jgi:hypothetical protein
MPHCINRFIAKNQCVKKQFHDTEMQCANMSQFVLQRGMRPRISSAPGTPDAR